MFETRLTRKDHFKDKNYENASECQNYKNVLDLEIW